LTREALRELLLAGAGASIDTRTLQPGEVFFGLPGSHAHGATFALLALKKGAAAVVVPPAYAIDLPPEKTFPHDEPLTLLQEEAAHYRQRFPHLHIIAIGGSNGKTTTRALLSHILSAYAPTLATPKSWNNSLGLPLTLLRIQPHHRYAVLEIGDNHPGEVAFLANLVRPTWGLLTNVGLDHLEGYGSYEANLHTKWELAQALERLSPAPRLFLNHEDEGLRQLAATTPIPVTFFGEGGEVSGTWHPLGWHRAEIHGQAYNEPFRIEVPLWGRFNRLNVLSAIAVARALKVPWPLIAKTLSTFTPEWGRSQVIEKNGQRIVFEAYNANPSSLRASLESLWEMLRPGETVGLILGQMEELGAFAPEAHRQILSYLRQHQRSLAGAALIGPLWKDFLKSTPEAPFAHYASVEAFLSAKPTWVQEAPILYLKGSRQAALEQVLTGLHAK
jgi:UDP-N-acetylmuramoyl-tripeptide--D-alanyl-D-alanine ligase